MASQKNEKVISKMSSKSEILSSFQYPLGKIEKGYNDRLLHINLKDMEINSREIPETTKEKFIGGRGYGLKYLFDAVSSDTKWNDDENEIIIAPGPISGITQYPGIGKSLVVSLSPLTNTVIDSNVGGYFGPLMKFSGFDALEIQGKAKEDIIIFIDGDTGEVNISKSKYKNLDSHILAEEITNDFALSESEKRNVAVVSAGIGSENTNFGILNFSFYDMKRKYIRIKQAGRGGIGSVFRNKKIAAIVVRYSGVNGKLNNPVDMDKINKLGKKIKWEIANLDSKQNGMRKRGTTFLVEVVSDLQILPVNNYKYGSHPEHYKINHEVWEKKFTQGIPDGCWYGCTMQCAKAVDGFELKTGPYKGQRVCVDGPEYETIGAVGSNCGIFDPQHIAEANFYCDTYGIDTISYGTGTAFIMECYERGILNKNITEGLELTFGNKDAAIELLHQMCKGKGFGKIAGQGIKKMKQIFTEKYGADPRVMQDIGMETKGLEYSEYVTKECPAQQIGYAMANKGPQHDEAWFFILDKLNETIEAKAKAIFEMSLIRTWFGLTGICKMPWADVVPADNDKTDEPYKVEEHLKNYRELFSAVTGKTITAEDMIEQSERMHTFQRAFNIKMGVGGRENDRPPYRAMGPVTPEEYYERQDKYDVRVDKLTEKELSELSLYEKMSLLRKDKELYYETLMDEVYKKRGWNNDGVPTLETIKRLGLDIPEVLNIIS